MTGGASPTLTWFSLIPLKSFKCYIMQWGGGRRRTSNFFKGRGWSKKYLSLYQIFISSSLCDVILNFKLSAHLRIICMDFAQFKVANGVSMRNAILRNLITVKTCFLQLHVPYTLLGAIAILKFI